MRMINIKSNGQGAALRQLCANARAQNQPRNWVIVTYKVMDARKQAAMYEADIARLGAVADYMRARAA